MNINEYLIQVLESINCEYVFGGSGTVNASLMIALSKSKKIKTIIIKNEQAASFMACGYSMFSDKLGVCFATGGPGAINVLSGLCVALSDSLPVLAITGYEDLNVLGKGSLSETSGLNRTPDAPQIFAAVTKKNFIITNPSQTCDIIEEAINTAFEGRPGPVHIHMPLNLITSEVTNYREINIGVPPIAVRPEKISIFIDALAESINKNKDILLLIGYGAIRSHAQKELLYLVDTYQIPFATTMDAKGILPEDHPLSLGVHGSSGDPGANKYFDDAQLIIALGNSFAQNATFNFKADLFKNKKLMHINIDKNEINKVYEADYSMISDIKPALTGILTGLAKKAAPCPPKTVKKDKWYDMPIEYTGKKIHPAELVKRLSKVLPENSIILGDAGGHMLWLNCYLSLTKNQMYQNPGSFGPMASNVNSAIGIKCSNPDKVVVSGCGDGGYLMAGFELLTAVEHNIPVIWVIFDNGEFNVIKDLLLKFFGEAPFMQFKNPDFISYAKACGAEGFRVEKIEEFEGVFKKAVALNKPVLIDVVVESEVYPPFII